MLALAGEEARASKWLREEMDAAVDGLLILLPRTLDYALGERIDGLNQRLAHQDRVPWNGVGGVDPVSPRQSAKTHAVSDGRRNKAIFRR
jgi:hypothetical protein